MSKMAIKIDFYNKIHASKIKEIKTWHYEWLKIQIPDRNCTVRTQIHIKKHTHRNIQNTGEKEIIFPFSIFFTYPQIFYCKILVNMNDNL